MTNCTSHTRSLRRRWMGLTVATILASGTLGATHWTAGHGGDESAGRALLVAKYPRTKGLLSALSKEAPELSTSVLTWGAEQGRKREPRIMAFVKEHHPELHALLKALRKDRRAAFHDALCELAPEVDALEALRASDGDDAADRRLAAWRIESQVRLLSTRYVLAPSDALAEELTRLLRQEETQKRIQLQAQVERLTKQIESAQTKRDRPVDDSVQQRLDKLTRKAKRRGNHP